jgi:hypothetical protein
MRRVPIVALVVVALLAAQVVGAVLASPARGVSLLWTLTASPLTATTGVQRVFTLTATNEDPLASVVSSSQIGCVVVDVPANFSVSAAAVTGSNSGGGWHTDSIVGNRVTVHSDSGGDRLKLLGWVRFTITATPLSTGSLAWSAKAYRDTSCTGGAALLGVPPIVLVTGPAVTPTPKPTPPPTPTPKPTATPKPIPTPTPTPTPILPLPSLPLPGGPAPTPPVPGPATPEPTPSLRGEPRPAPTDASVSAPGSSPGASASPGPEGPSATPGAGSPGGALLPGSNSSPGGPSDQPPAAGTGAPGNGVMSFNGPTVAFSDAQLDLGTVGIGLLSGLDVWTVPAATLGVPGILLLVWVALQTVGALAWIPAVRKLRGTEEETL